MTALTDPREEARAQALAMGLSPTAAALAAGSGGDWRRARERAAAPEVAARVAALRDAPAWDERADVAGIIRALLRLARKAAEMPTPAAMGAARGLLAEAAKLQNGLQEKAEARTFVPPAAPRFGPLSDEDWLAKYAPKTSAASPAGP